MPEGNIFIEKRTHPRVSETIPIKYYIFEDPIQDCIKREKDSQTLDLSLGGVYLKADQDLKVGTILRLNITLPNMPETIPTFAEVCWVSSKGAGLHFLVMSEDDEEALKTYISKKMVDKKSDK